MRPTKILIVKLGLDSHWRGAQMVASFLRDKGMEVIYAGNLTPEAIVENAMQEDVDYIGVSTLSGNHLTLLPKLMNIMKEKGMEKVSVLLGGTIPRADISEMKKLGVAEVFPTGSTLKAIEEFIR
ncbi:cobalamin-dependent protein [Metallumcola ferriviriculae]|uniref:Cobalamin-dependent protein n=1 Tax=Metallumcola ferriviriculae TaxID=3039180 RepID=A0AAU0UQE9_9FIRM|nr:cobalamin-dependent protein [Desulfitibacteraceae bacterium MK1]